MKNEETKIRIHLFPPLPALLGGCFSPKSCKPIASTKTKCFSHWKMKLLLGVSFDVSFFKIFHRFSVTAK